MTNLKFSFPAVKDQEQFEVIAPIIGATKEEGCKTFSLQIEGFRPYLFEGARQIVEVNFYLYEDGNLLEICFDKGCLDFENITYCKASFDEWL